MHTLLYLCPVILTLIIETNCEQYELPPIISSDDRSVRLNEIQEISEPNIMLNKIYRREVYKLQSQPKETNYSIISQFPPCKQTPPQITFKNIGYYHLQQPLNPYSETQTVTNNTQPIKKSTSIIYDYEALKIKTQNIIDMVFFDNQIFTISSTGIINVYRLNPDLENGIALMMSVKGVDWENLYQIRMDKWNLAEEQEKQRLKIIDQIKKKIAQREKRKNGTLLNDSLGDLTELNNDPKKNPPLLGGEQQPLLGGSETTSKSSNLIQPPSSRFLQNIDFNNPSPKVQTDPKVSPKVKINDSLDSLNQTSNETYYTGPPPENIRSHLQKGYFEVLEDNKLLIFANSYYLIGFDVVKNQSILFSEQLSFDYLFADKENKNSTSNNITTNTTGNNSSKNQTINTTISNSTGQNKTQNLTINSVTTNSTQTNTTSNKTAPSEPQEEIPPYPEPTPSIPPEFTPLSQFEQITKINETHFAIIDKKKGVVIYEVLKRRLNTSSQFVNNPESYFIRKAAFLGKEQFGKTYQENEEMNLVDVVYCKNKSLLLVLDYEKGIVAFEKFYQKQNSTSITKLTQKEKQKPIETFILSPYTILKKMCSLMQLQQGSQSLLLSCNKIYRVSLRNWPRITEKTYPHPLINIREIFVQQDKELLILSGYSVFKVMYLDRTTNYFQDDMLDKIIFNKDLVITANQNHIIVLKYRVDKPVIMCSTSNKSLLGTHNLVLRTTAQCNEPYLKSISYTKPQGENDICIYTVYKNIYIWQQGEVPLKPLAIVMLVFLIFIVVMIIWFVLIKFRMQSAQQRLKYLKEEGHKELVEEDVYSEKDTKSDKSVSGVGKSFDMIENHNQQLNQENTQEQDHKKDLYSIE